MFGLRHPHIFMGISRKSANLFLDCAIGQQWNLFCEPSTVFQKASENLSPGGRGYMCLQTMRMLAN
jgi:hypothetical protein